MAPIKTLNPKVYPIIIPVIVATRVAAIKALGNISFKPSIKNLIEFTKLDENNISAEEFSSIAENNCCIGYLTDTKSILKSINFVNKEILAQYLKDNIVNFCKWEIKWLSQ